MSLVCSQNENRPIEKIKIGMKSHSSPLTFGAAETPIGLPSIEIVTSPQDSSLLLDAIEYVESDAGTGGDYLAILVDGGFIVTMVVGSVSPIVVERKFTYNRFGPETSTHWLFEAIRVILDDSSWTQDTTGTTYHTRGEKIFRSYVDKCHSVIREEVNAEAAIKAACPVISSDVLESTEGSDLSPVVSRSIQECTGTNKDTIYHKLANDTVNSNLSRTFIIARLYQIVHMLRQFLLLLLIPDNTHRSLQRSTFIQPRGLTSIYFRTDRGLQLRISYGSTVL